MQPDSTTSSTILLALITGLGSLLLQAFLTFREWRRSRNHIEETQTGAQIKAQQARTDADLLERKRYNDNNAALINLLQGQQGFIGDLTDRDEERHKVNDENQKAYLELSKTRTEQLKAMQADVKEQIKMSQEVGKTAQEIKGELDKHIKETEPAVKAITEVIPPTLERIEKKVDTLQENFNKLPQAIKDAVGIDKLMDDLKAEVHNFVERERQAAQAPISQTVNVTGAPAAPDVPPKPSESGKADPLAGPGDAGGVS